MSRQIDYLSKPLSAEDRAYLKARSRRPEILANERLFPEGVAGDEDATQELESAQGTPEGEQTPAADVAPEDKEWVESLTVDELKAELAERDMSQSGNKPDLQARLLESLAEEDEQL